MASNAPLFVNANDRRWNPDAIVFDSSRLYGTPSYWMQHFFKESNGANLLNSTLIEAKRSSLLIASAILWKNPEDDFYLRIKIVNLGGNIVNLKISIDNLKESSRSIEIIGSRKIQLTSGNLMDENSFEEPEKVVPQQGALEVAKEYMNVVISPHSFTCFDLLLTEEDMEEEDEDVLSRLASRKPIQLLLSQR